MICALLKQALSNSDLKSHVKSEAFVSGVVFGVSAAPEIPMPEQWMPWVLDGHHEIPLSNERVDELASGLIAQLQWQLGKMKDNDVLLPDECLWSDQASERTHLEAWLSGLLYSHQSLESVWRSAWSKASIEDAESRLARCLKCFSVLANSELTLSNLDKEKQASLKDNLPTLSHQLEKLLKDYVDLAGELAQALPGQFEMVDTLDTKLKH